MTYQKIKPCPECAASDEDLQVYVYESGWRHVECDACFYMGPGEGNIREAIRSHNVRCVEASRAEAARFEAARVAR